MRWLALLTLLLAGVVGLLWANDDKKPDEPVKDFVVHEWGVWRVHHDVELANADVRATWDELPKFVYGQTMSRDFPSHFVEPAVVKKPVIFFHAPKAMEAQVRVEFPTGVPAVWWPATETPAYKSEDYHGRGRALGPPVKFLEWKLHLKQALGANRQLPELKPVSKTHWMKVLRDVKCDDVYVPPFGQSGIGQEREKFVYYDGLLPRGDAVSVTVEKERVSLKNQAKFAVLDVWIIDNRDAKPRLGRLPRLDAKSANDMDLTAVKDGRWAEDAGKALTAQLHDAGLNEDEAAALTTIWAAEFFHSAGMTLLYRLPQEEYDRLLPLTVKPRPEKVVRVGLVQQVLVQPEMAARIARLVRQLDDNEFDKREAAQQELAKMGRAVFGELLRLKPTTTAPEPRRRLEELLEKLDAQRALKK